MISCELAGGLGNYMFQIATGYTLAKENNDDFCIDFSTTLTQPHKNIKTYKDNILRKVDDKIYDFEYRYQEPHFTYNEVPYRNNLIINGCFQSEKYLNRGLILDLYSIDDNSLEYIKDKYDDLQDSVSLHVRRADYLSYPAHPPVDISYCERAMEHIGLDHTFYIMSDDIKWCKENLKGDNLIFVEGEEDYIDMWMMSLCAHNIIANSSFSWWGAWLNVNDEKKVVAPKQWFSSDKRINTQDLYCDGWVIL
tara:strand:- start:1017 stop:1769 length:753 start_codon:yes stop_codon:yes gene_type:complete